MKAKVVYEYVEALDTLTMCFLIGILLSIAFTVYKVNKVLAKPHMI